ncbi:MAG: hypothetical protein WC358_00025 [Ignavibacteria bacterium]|jgi:hypothetical protein
MLDKKEIPDKIKKHFKQKYFNKYYKRTMNTVAKVSENPKKNNVIKITEGTDTYYYSLKSIPNTFKVPSVENADRMPEKVANTMSKYLTMLQVENEIIAL